MVEHKVAIVIPAFNEERTIAKVVRSLIGFGTVVVVDDGSEDKTAKIAKENGALVIYHEKNNGYDSALNTGFNKAFGIKSDAVITIDADGQHDLGLVKEYMYKLANGADLVLGIRHKPARISELFFMLYTRIRFKWKDPLCGMKGYSSKLYNGLGYFDSYNSIGTELASFGLANGYKSVQIPVNIIERQDDSRFYSSIKSNFFVVRSMLKMMTKYGLRL